VCEPRIIEHPLGIRSEEKDHPAIGKLGKHAPSAVLFHRGAALTPPGLVRRHIGRTVSYDTACERVVVEVRGHALQAEPNRGVRPAAGMTVEIVDILGEVQAE
jgi:hypothetical protein